MSRIFATRGAIAAEERPDRVRPRAGRLASAALLLSASFVLSRVLGLIRNAVIAAVFGDTRPVEAYFAAFRIPDTMYTLVSGGALASAFIPVFVGLLHEQRDREAWRTASTVLNAVSICLAGLAVAAFIFAPVLMSVLVGGGGFTHSEQALSVDLTRIMLLQPIFLGASAILTSILQSYRRFVLTAIAPLAYNVVVIVGALLGHSHGVQGLAWSVVIGALAQVIIQVPGIWPEARRRYRLRVDRHTPSAREVLHLFVPRVIGLAAFQAMLIITLYLASGLPQGSIGAINYSWVLVFFPIGALGTAAANVVFPVISGLAVAQDFNAIRRTVNRSLRLVLFLAVPAAIGLIVLRRPIINLIYGHGAWTNRATEQTAFALLFYAMGLAQLTSIEIFPRVFYSMRDTATPVRIAVVAVLLDAALSILLVHTFPRASGQGGLALATAIATTLQAIWLALALEKRLGGIGRASILGTLRDSGLAGIGMGVVLYVLLDPLTAILPQHGIGVLVTVAFEVVLGVAIFGAISYFLGAPELWEVRGFVARQRT